MLCSRCPCIDVGFITMVYSKTSMLAQISSGSYSWGLPNQLLIWCNVSPPSLDGLPGQVMALLARHDSTYICRPPSLPLYSLMNANGGCRACTLEWGQIMMVAMVVGVGINVQWRVTVKLVNRFILLKGTSSLSSPYTCPETLDHFTICHSPLSILL